MASAVEDRFEMALLAARQGRIEDARRVCLDIVSTDPSHVGANLMLGIAAARSGRSDDAVRHLTLVLGREPANFEALKWLAGVLNRQGRHLEAAEAAQRAIDIRADDFAVHMALAGAYFAAGRLEESAAAHMRAIEADPSREAAYFGLSETRLRQGNPAGAREALLEAARHAPSPKCYLRLGEICVQLGLSDEAVKWVRGVPPGSAEETPGLVTLAVALRNLGDLDQEGRVLDRLAALQPNHPALFLLRGFRLQTQGRFSDAESEFLRAIEVQPHQGGAYHSITIGRKITEKDLPLVEQMERVAEAGGLPPNEAGPLHFALGKAYDDLGRPGQAMPQFIEGNRLTRVSLGLRPFDREALARDVERTMDLFTRDYFRENLRPHPYEPTPIVIAGAMRSGTTLVEQILSSHPHVAPAGEQVFWRRAAPDCVLYDPYDPEAGVMHEVIRRKSQEYVDHLRELAPGYEFVTDKEPANHRLFGLIRLALPNSPLIQLRRNLADVAVSMFTTHFQTGEEYVWDRDDIVFALKQHARLAAHWRKVMPRDRFLEVDYTALVTDPEPTIRRIVEFCGLDWDDACLHPEQNERRVNTPSFWQVRQPLNPGSVDRWRRYDGHLGPFAELVEL